MIRDGSIYRNRDCRPGVRRLLPGYSSPYGCVHNPNITNKPKVYMGEGVPLNSICVGHMSIAEVRDFVALTRRW